MVARRAAAGLIAAGSLVAGCGAQAAPPAGEAPAPAAAQPSATLAGDGLAALDPCRLLSTVDRSTAGLSSPGENKTIGTGRACDWTEPGTFGLTVTLDDSTALSDLQVRRGTGKKVTVGHHQAVKVSGGSAGDGTCAVLLAAGVNASVQVDVTNSSFSDTTLACQRATTVAKLIEPKLP